MTPTPDHIKIGTYATFVDTLTTNNLLGRIMLCSAEWMFVTWDEPTEEPPMGLVDALVPATEGSIFFRLEVERHELAGTFFAIREWHASQEGDPCPSV